MASDQPGTARIPRPVLRAMVEAYGGKFHGPRVEHLSMPEEEFWQLMDAVVALAWRRQVPELL